MTERHHEAGAKPAEEENACVAHDDEVWLPWQRRGGCWAVNSGRWAVGGFYLQQGPASAGAKLIE